MTSMAFLVLGVLLSLAAGQDARAEAERLARSGARQQALERFQALAAENPDDIASRVWIGHGVVRREGYRVVIDAVVGVARPVSRHAPGARLLLEPAIAEQLGVESALDALEHELDELPVEQRADPAFYGAGIDGDARRSRRESAFRCRADCGGGGESDDRCAPAHDLKRSTSHRYLNVCRRTMPAPSRIMTS